MLDVRDLAQETSHLSSSVFQVFWVSFADLRSRLQSGSIDTLTSPYLLSVLWCCLQLVLPLHFPSSSGAFVFKRCSAWQEVSDWILTAFDIPSRCLEKSSGYLSFAAEQQVIPLTYEDV